MTPDAHINENQIEDSPTIGFACSPRFFTGSPYRQFLLPPLIQTKVLSRDDLQLPKL